MFVFIGNCTVFTRNSSKLKEQKDCLLVTHVKVGVRFMCNIAEIQHYTRHCDVLTNIII